LVKENEDQQHDPKEAWEPGTALHYLPEPKKKKIKHASELLRETGGWVKSE